MEYCSFLLGEPVSSIPFVLPTLRILQDDKEDKEYADVFLDENPQNSTTIRQLDNPAPYIIVVQGPPRVGKSLLIKSLVKHFTPEHHTDIQGPITVRISDMKTQLQFVECPDDVDGMIDAAKYADLVLLLIDASYQFQEMETFEFLNLLRVHRFPKVIGVTTHLDEYYGDKPDQAEECLEKIFRSKICDETRVFHFSGLQNELYKRHEISDLALYISHIESHPLSWRSTQPYVLVDRFEDATPLEQVQNDKQCNRNINLYGYLRGCNIKNENMVHIAGVGDFLVAHVKSSAHPLHRSFSRNAMEFVDPEQVNMDELNRPAELTWSEIEGFRPGTYLYMEVLGVPFQMVENFDPCHPILVGGFYLEEQNVGYMQVKLRRHNWHMGLLKSEDTITVSSGWRRYQTIPIYAKEDNNGQHRYIEKIPENEQCLAMFWGPLAPPETRIAVVQSNKVLFRIAANAVVLDSEHSVKRTIKRTSTGRCVKSHETTAVVKFPPDIGIANFEDILWSPTGNAMVTKIFGPSVGQAEGSGLIVECTSHRGIKVGMTVTMTGLCQVPRFYNPLLTVDRTVTADKDSLEKDNRRSVLIVRKGHTNSLLPHAVKYTLR